MAINVISQGYRHSLTTSLKRFCERHSCISILPIWSVYSSIYKNLGEYAYLLLRWSDVRSDRSRSNRKAGRPVGRGAGDERRAGGRAQGRRLARPLEMQRKSRLAHQKRDFGYISGPGSTAADASRALARRWQPHLGTRRNGVGRISVQNESAPAGIESDGGALVAPHYKPQLPKLTPRYRAS